MTLKRFQQLLKKIDPRLRIRRRPGKNVVGLFVGLSGKGGYICRVNEGELHLNGWRLYFEDKNNIGKPVEVSKIKSRGRKTVVRLLSKYRWVTNNKQRSMLTWGIDYPDKEVAGLTGHSNT